MDRVKRLPVENVNCTPPHGYQGTFTSFAIDNNGKYKSSVMLEIGTKNYLHSLLSIQYLFSMTQSIEGLRADEGGILVQQHITNQRTLAFLLNRQQHKHIPCLLILRH